MKIIDKFKALDNMGDETDETKVTYSTRVAAVVEGLNMVKKAVKQKKQNQKGGITSVEAPIPVGKLMIVCKKCGPTRIGYVVDGETKKRVCRKCGGDL